MNWNSFIAITIRSNVAYHRHQTKKTVKEGGINPVAEGGRWCRYQLFPVGPCMA